MIKVVYFELADAVVFFIFFSDCKFFLKNKNTGPAWGSLGSNNSIFIPRNRNNHKDVEIASNSHGSFFSTSPWKKYLQWK